MSLILGLAALTLAHCLPTHQADAKPTPPAAVRHDDEQRITALAAAAYVAGAAYDEARATPNPAATLDNICDALPDVMPDVVRVVSPRGTQFAETMHAAIGDRLWAFTVVEHARTTWDPGYGYIADGLVDGLKKGSNPASVRADVHRITGQLAAMKAGQ